MKIRHLKTIDDVENFERRRSAVVKRMIASKDSSKKCSLFAWGRMTITIKDKKGDTMELWKPKRRDIIAIFANIYQNRESLFEHVQPYKMVFEDATAINAPSTELESDEDDFVALQEELDRHWGVHKRKLCPGLKKPSHLCNVYQQSPPMMAAAYIPSNQTTYSYSSTPSYTTLQNGKMSSLMNAAHMLSNLDSRWNGSYYQDDGVRSSNVGPMSSSAVKYEPYHPYGKPHGSPRDYDDNCMRGYVAPASPRDADPVTIAKEYKPLPRPMEAYPSAAISTSPAKEGKHWRPW